VTKTTKRVKPTLTIHVFQKKILVWSGPFVYSELKYTSGLEHTFLYILLERYYWVIFSSNLLLV